MIANTHRVVGEFLYQQLSPSNQRLVQKQRFVYGNVKPDISKKYLQMSHYHRDNEEIIFKMLNDLLTTQASIREFSENLGVLIHFFCDYTCIYHANDYLYENHSIAKHLRYELMLHRYTVKKLEKLKTVETIPFESVDEIQKYVSQLTNRLNQVPLTRSVSEDFEEMMVLSLSVMQYIINQYEFDKLLITHNKKEG
ncbi:MAG: zinc dependent phospholipase C family protein [Turicibacter sp.]|nr:zinc dependent phospholipase C family protein [Turicibacter sp.]